jgi:hypothetical protein
MILEINVGLYIPLTKIKSWPNGMNINKEEKTSPTVLGFLPDFYQNVMF